MQYVEVAPPPVLAPYVRRFWGLRDEATSASRPLERVVPDGRMELIVHLGDPFSRVQQDGRSSSQGHALWAGQLDAPLLLRPGQRIDLFAIRFQPCGAAALLGLDAAALAGRLVPLDDLLGKEADRLVGALAAADGTHARAAVAAAWCHARLRRARGFLPVVAEAARLAQLRPATLTVAQLAEHVGWGRRRLERGFAAHVGLAPKTFLRIARMQRVLAGLEASAGESLALAASTFGYFDQAHLTREFRDLVGTTPGRWLREQNGLGDVLIDPAP